MCLSGTGADLVGNEDVELQHPLPPLAGLHLHPLPLPDGGRLEGVVGGQVDKQLNTELVEMIDY